MRKVFIVLSPRALPYAELGITSLFKNALEALDVTLITDSAADKQTLIEAIGKIANPKQHNWQVFDEHDGEERAIEQFKGLEHLQAFRHGHPCWRKLTDPLLFIAPGEEAIILDPDLYFPNQFTFEPTPENTILLMWQQPNCLFPPESVYTALKIPVKLANHVDIGVAHVRAPIDLEWFDWLVKELGGTQMPRIMHIEAIIWSAMAMKMGGGHLNPERWLCWHRTQWKRVLLKLGVTGTQILKQEKLAAAKCFHAGGPAKWWLADAFKAGILDQNQDLSLPSAPIPFEELTPEMYASERRLKDTLEGLGYYKLFGSSN